MMENNRKASLEGVLHELKQRREELENVLPADLSFDRFYASVGQALRFNPGILDCKPSSIVTACVKAAYDGLRIDGREAAIVEHKHKIKKGPNQGQTILLAQYFPMAFGLIQQIYRGKEVIAISTDVIYEKDEYSVQKGTNAAIHHVPSLDKDRGNIVAAYSVATLKSGAVTFEFLTGADLDAIRNEAKTKYVWDKWPGEMSKKSAIRRHRKTLPLGDRDIIDAETSEMFPEYASSAELRLGNQRSAPRPERKSIPDQSGTENGADLDLTGDDEREAVTIDADMSRNSTSDEGEKIDTQGERLRNETSDEEANLKGDALEMPQGEQEWLSWCQDLGRKIQAAADAEAVDALEQENTRLIDAAEAEMAKSIRMELSDKRADLLADAS